MFKTTAIYCISCNVNHDNKKEKKTEKHTATWGQKETVRIDRYWIGVIK